MRKQFGTGRGLKRYKGQEKFPTGRHAKNQRVEEMTACSPSPTSSGESSGEQSSDVASEEVIYREQSLYDNLLMTLGSCNRSLADAYKKRQRQEEGKSDTEDDEVDDSESLSVSEEEGNDSEGN